MLFHEQVNQLVVEFAHSTMGAVVGGVSVMTVAMVILSIITGAWPTF